MKRAIGNRQENAINTIACGMTIAVMQNAYLEAINLGADDN